MSVSSICLRLSDGESSAVISFCVYYFVFVCSSSLQRGRTAPILGIIIVRAVVYVGRGVSVWRENIPSFMAQLVYRLDLGVDSDGLGRGCAAGRVGDRSWWDQIEVGKEALHPSSASSKASLIGLPFFFCFFATLASPSVSASGFVAAAALSS